jgi:hypothetical protein
LRRWTPRRPSPDLRARVFGRGALIRSAALALSEFSRWVVPAFGCFVLVVGGLSRGPARVALEGEASSWSAGRERIMLAEARQHSEINAVPVTRMEQRIGMALFQEPSGASLISYTNKLIQK